MSLPEPSRKGRTVLLDIRLDYCVTRFLDNVDSCPAQNREGMTDPTTWSRTRT